MPGVAVDDQPAAVSPVAMSTADSPGHKPSRRPSVLLALGVAAVALAAARVLAVDVAGIVTNDSLGYLRRAEDPVGAGFVSQGYRQAAYPLLLSGSNAVGDLFGWDHIFGVALLQRSLLVIALAATIWALRWWSVPVLTLGTSASFVVHSDLLLPEGFLIPACLLVGSLAAAVTARRVETGTVAAVVLVVSSVTSALCASIKLQYGVLIALCGAVAWLLVKDRLLSRRFGTTVVGATLTFILFIATAQAFENRSELGVFEPVSERARAEWYGAWQAVFVVHPDNRNERALARFYDSGDLYSFLHGIEREVSEYRARAEIIRARVDSMFDAAGTTQRREQLSAFLGGLRAGRTDDLRGIVNRVRAAPPGDAALRLTFNSAARSGGPDVVVDALNDGKQPGVVSFGPLFDSAQRAMADHRPWRSALSVVSIILMGISLIIRGRHRAMVLATLGVAVVASAALALGYIDNARYLLGPLSISVIGGTVAARALLVSSAAGGLQRRLR